MTTYFQNWDAPLAAFNLLDDGVWLAEVCPELNAACEHVLTVFDEQGRYFDTGGPALPAPYVPIRRDNFAGIRVVPQASIEGKAFKFSEISDDDVDPKHPFQYQFLVAAEFLQTVSAKHALANLLEHGLCVAHQFMAVNPSPSVRIYCHTQAILNDPPPADETAGGTLLKRLYHRFMNAFSGDSFTWAHAEYMAAWGRIMQQSRETAIALCGPEMLREGYLAHERFMGSGGLYDNRYLEFLNERIKQDYVKSISTPGGMSYPLGDRELAEIAADAARAATTEQTTSVLPPPSAPTAHELPTLNPDAFQQLWFLYQECRFYDAQTAENRVVALEDKSDNAEALRTAATERLMERYFPTSSNPAYEQATSTLFWGQNDPTTTPVRDYAPAFENFLRTYAANLNNKTAEDIMLRRAYAFLAQETRITELITPGQETITNNFAGFLNVDANAPSQDVVLANFRDKFEEKPTAGSPQSFLTAARQSQGSAVMSR